MRRWRRRDHLDVEADIVRAATQPIKFTNLMYRARLPYYEFLVYLNELIVAELIVRGPTFIETTDKGRRFLAAYDSAKRLVGDSAVLGSS